MRTCSFLPVVYLSNVGQTVSFSGGRQVQPVVPPTPTALHSVPFAEEQVVYIEKKHEAKSLSSDASQKIATKESEHAKPSLQQLQERRKGVFAVYLAVMAGALDVVCFQKFGCFSHLMTGNTVKCLTAATEMKFAEATFYAVMVASYTAGAAGFRLVDIIQRRKPNNNTTAAKDLSTLTILGSILLPIFALSESVVRLMQLPAATVAFLWAFGNGMVNASTMYQMGVVTNAVTGHWNKFGITAMDRILLGQKQEATKTTYKVLVATALSVAGTGLCTKLVGDRFKLGGLLSPSGILIGLMYFAIFRWYGRGPRQS